LVVRTCQNKNAGATGPHFVFTGVFLQ